MDIALLVIAIVAVLVAAAYGTIAWRQARKKEPKLLLWHNAEPMITSVNDPEVTIAWKGEIVADPYLLRLGIRNVGQSDLTSTMFDGERSISVGVTGAELVSMTPTPLDDGWFEDHHDEIFSINYGPDLLKAGNETVATLIISGQPSIYWDHYLVNIDVTEQTPEQMRLESVREITKSLSPHFLRETIVAALLCLIAVVSYIYSIQK